MGHVSPDGLVGMVMAPEGLVGLIGLVGQISCIGFLSLINWMGLVGLVHLVSLFGLMGLVGLGCQVWPILGIFLLFYLIQKYFQMEFLSLMIQKNLMIPKL